MSLLDCQDFGPGMRGAIVEYVRRSGLVSQSIEAALPELPRWEGRLRKRGIEAAPRYPRTRAGAS